MPFVDRKVTLMTELLLKEEVFAVVGAAIEVHRELGCGFLEAVYQEAMELELADRNLPFLPQVALRITYKTRTLKKEYVADLLCFGQLIVELKAIDRLTSVEEAKLLNYLKATGLRVGLLVNFGASGRLEWKRFVR
jgi:GxxExxY protein